MNPIELIIVNLKTATAAMNEIEVKGYKSVSCWMDVMNILKSTISSMEGALENAKTEEVSHANCNNQRKDV